MTLIMSLITEDNLGHLLSKGHSGEHEQRRQSDTMYSAYCGVSTQGEYEKRVKRR
jgi:hypothetical protein